MSVARFTSARPTPLVVSLAVVEDGVAAFDVDGRGCSRVPRRELNQALAEAFADPDDPQVYRALLSLIRTALAQPWPCPAGLPVVGAAL